MESVWMTLAVRERLAGELAVLENATYAVAPQDAARARELREILRNAQVGVKPDDGLVEPGMRVEV